MSARILIASDGSVHGLLGAACALKERGPGQLLCPSLVGGGPEGAVRAAIEAQAELLGHQSVPRREIAISGNAPGERLSRGMLDLGYFALRENVRDLIWAVGAPRPENEGVAALVGVLGRAMLVERLVGLERPPEAEPLSVRVPYADLTDRQVADLVLDLDLPLWLCWWWTLARGPRGVEGAEEARLEYQRWESALKEAGWRDGMPGPEVVTKARVAPAEAASP